MENFILSLPRLSLPNITITSTFLKLIEEIGEAKEQLRELNDFEKKYSVGILSLLEDNDLHRIKEEFQLILKDSLKEIIDITQTCVSLLFVFEENKQISTDLLNKVFQEHISEVCNSEAMDSFYIIEENGFKYMHLPISNKSMELSDLLDDIVIASGQYAQLVGKYSKLSGEKTLNKEVSEQDIIHDSLKNLIRIAQNSYDVLHHMSIKYNVNLASLFDEHIAKLKSRGYLGE